jgi:hypothetical protein
MPALRKSKLMVSAWLIFFYGLSLTSTHSREVAGVFFEDFVNAEYVTLSKRGEGLFRYLGLFRAYAGALYLEDGKPTEKVLSNSAKRLELEYFIDIKGDDFGPVTTKLLARNIDPESLAALKDRIKKLNSLYEDVKPGDRYSLTFIPGKGTELALNGEPKGIIEGDDFAPAIYSIWLGKNPISIPFKNQLLGTQ